jgi:hypothetical protein
MDREPQIRHEFKLGPSPGPWDFTFGFMAKVVVPIWHVGKNKNGETIRTAGWMPALIRGAKPSDVIANLERIIQGYVKTGVYRRTKKR